MKRWHKISKNPLDIKNLSYRQNYLLEANNPQLIENRIDYFCLLAKDKKVLDVGVIEHTREAINNPEWLHGNLYKASSQCVGVDIIPEEVEYLKSLGYDVICTDLTKESLSDKFDVIIVGEVLEHLDAPGYLFANLAKMLKNDGKLIISVPNPWYVNVILKTAFSSPYVDNVDHVAWFDPCTISELGSRHGLRLKSFSGVFNSSELGRNYIAKMFFRSVPFLIKIGFSPNIFAKTMIYEFVANNENEQEKAYATD